MRSILSLLVGALLATQVAAAPAAPVVAPPPITPATPGAPPKTSPPPPAQTPPVVAPPPAIPKPSEIPAAWKNEGAGEFDNKKADPVPTDYAFQNKAIGAVAELKKSSMPDAARHLEHYLKITGTDLPVNVDKMLAELPMLKNLANYDSVYQGQMALGKMEADKGSSTFVIPWMNVTPENPNWLYAMGTFKYSMTGLITKTGNDAAKLEYKVHVFKKYNWDEGAIKVGKDDKKAPAFTKEQKELASLHLKGLAREYVIVGSSCVHTINDLSNARLPAKPPGREKDAPLPPKKNKPEYQEKGCKITADALRHRPCAHATDKCPAFGQQPKGKHITLECYVEGQNIKGDKTTKYVLPLSCSPVPFIPCLV
jgi:hypothetical protein